jgi:nickel transport protein
MKKCFGMFVIFMLVAAAGVSAHDTWVAQEGDGLVVLRGHDGKGGDLYKPENVKEAKAFDAGGKEQPITIKAAENKALLPTDKAPALVGIVYYSGNWVKTPEGWKNVSKREAKEVLESSRGTTYSKNLFQWHDAFAKSLGAKMEIIPLKNPLALKVGDTLPVQVLYGGKPLTNVGLKGEGHGQAEMTTDAQGQAAITLRRDGLYIISANLKTPLPNDPDADALSETANLTFTIK